MVNLPRFEHEASQGDSPRAIYSATQTCRQPLSDCILLENLMQTEWAENCLADFNLWVSDIGASVQEKASLDARLTTRPDTRDAVANLLDVLTGTIGECKDLGKSIMTQIPIKRLSLTVNKLEDLPRSVILVAMTVIPGQTTKKILHVVSLPGQMIPSQIQTWRPCSRIPRCHWVKRRKPSTQY